MELLGSPPALGPIPHLCPSGETAIRTWGGGFSVTPIRTHSPPSPTATLFCWPALREVAVRSWSASRGRIVGSWGCVACPRYPWANAPLGSAPRWGRKSTPARQHAGLRAGASRGGGKAFAGTKPKHGAALVVWPAGAVALTGPFPSHWSMGCARSGGRGGLWLRSVGCAKENGTTHFK